MFIPNTDFFPIHPGSGFFPSRIPDPDTGVKKAPDSGSATHQLPGLQAFQDTAKLPEVEMRNETSAKFIPSGGRKFCLPIISIDAERF